MEGTAPVNPEKSSRKPEESSPKLENATPQPGTAVHKLDKSNASKAALFNRSRIHTLPLSSRVNKLELQRDTVNPDTYAGPPLSAQAAEDARRAAREILAARAAGIPVILAFGAHSIKNGLARVLIRLLRGGFVTHFATNGAGIIHDWEFAYQGRTGEDVRRYVAEGQFGIWEETGSYLNLALAVGAWRDLGYGEAVGAMVAEGGLVIPSVTELRAAMEAGAKADADIGSIEKAAAAADLLALVKTFKLPAGTLRIDHPNADSCLAAVARAEGVPFTCHPMIGHDIIYTHPMSRGAPIGRTADRDFLSFAQSVSNLEGGVYLSVGSAVMSPMIFEKALSMARNVLRPSGPNSGGQKPHDPVRTIENFSIYVVDLAKSTWDWTKDGEPPQDDPAYYLRFCKTFSRMGGRMSYTSADNRSWLVALLKELEA